MNKKFSFRVGGKAVTQGSKRLVRTRGPNPKTIMLDYNHEALALWRAEVRLWASQYVEAPTERPVRLKLFFFRARPQHHFNTKNGLKDSAPVWPISKNSGDVDKLARAILDALTGTVYVDDSQVVRLTVGKYFASFDEPEGVEVEVEIDHEDE